MSDAPVEPVNLSHPKFGSVSSSGGFTGKLHLAARHHGYDYLSLLSWDVGAGKVSWHFYNRKVDARLQALEQPERFRLLSRLLRSLSSQELSPLFSYLNPPKQMGLKLPEADVDVVELVSPLETGATVEPNTAVEVPVVDAETFTHNLIGYFEELNAQFFSNELTVPILWTRQSTRHLRSGITFGLFDHDRREIRINARLNQPWVPDYFVKMVVYHEMLHVVVKPRTADGRTFYHHREFRAREREFPDFKKAILWQRANLRRILKRQSRD